MADETKADTAFWWAAKLVYLSICVAMAILLWREIIK